jgi:hypothetical protein
MMGALLYISSDAGSAVSHPGGLPKLPPFKQALFDIIVAAQRHGAIDLTAKEIQAKYENLTSKRVDNSNVAGRISEMVREGYLAASSEKRRCVESQSEGVRAVYVPATQARIFN